MSLSLDELRQWIGRSESRVERLTPGPVAALSATLDRDDPAPREGDDVPPLWHWLYFLPLAPQSQLGEDGHPKRGGFLPTVSLPRRMWAGGDLTFHQPLSIGDSVTRVSTIDGVDLKQGRTGALVFVKVRHELNGVNGLAITEYQDIVYRGPAVAAESAKPLLAPDKCERSREITPSEALLFRYSALTFNSHRIHYDRPYATSVEGYPNLVVQGPLTATLLVDLLRRALRAVPIDAFRFRGVTPLFSSASFDVCAAREADSGTVQLWAKNSQGALAMEASAVINSCRSEE